MKENASKLHRKIGEVLTSSNLFKHHKIFEEYPVSSINSSYTNNRHLFDWVVLDLAIVIEAHGQQHYSYQRFGSEFDPDQLQFIQYRDKVKRDAAVQAGFTYLEIPYNDINIIDEQYIYKLWQDHKNPLKIEKENSLEKNKAREWRKKIYQQKRERDKRGL